MIKSKTKIEKRLKKKKNPELVETIIACKKTNSKVWLKIATMLTYPRRKQIKVNLDIINKETTEGDTVVVPGKVLSQGEVDKKVRVCALSFSQEALRKLKEKKCEIISIIEEIKINPKAEGIKILK